MAVGLLGYASYPVRAAAGTADLEESAGADGEISEEKEETSPPAEAAGMPEELGEAAPEPPRAFLEAYWDQGVKYRIRRFSLVERIAPKTAARIESAFTEYLTGTIGVRFQTDAAGYFERAGLEEIDDGIEVRRAFFGVTGESKLIKPVYGNLQVGVITDSAYLDTVYLEVRELPYVGSFRFGQFDGPMSLEQLGSSMDTVFMEKGSPVQAFAPGLKSGLQIADQFHDGRMTGAVGWFANAANLDVGDTTDSFARVIGRLSWVSAGGVEEHSEHFLHLAFSTSYLFSAEGDVRYQSRPESYMAPPLVDTGSIDADHAVTFGTEAAWVNGPHLVQAEYLHALVGGAPGGSVHFPGFYVFASKLLTGESHPYRPSSGTLGRVVPRRPLSLRGRTWGAWEVGARFSFLDLKNGSVKGGMMNLLTLGCNWYWNRYIRWQFNYGFGDVDKGTSDGRLHVLQTRFQFGF